MHTFSGRFGIAAGSLKSGYTTGAVTKDGDTVTAAVPSGSSISGDSAGMNSLALAILGETGHVTSAKAADAVPSKTDPLARSYAVYDDETGGITIYATDGEVLATYSENVGTHSRVS